jgi:DHA3 family tetracycline resistance protein-like MFS transporter
MLAVLMPENGWERTAHQSMWSQVALGGRAVRTSPVLIGLVAGTLFLGMSSEGFDRLSQPHFLLDVGLPSMLSRDVWFGVLAIAGALISIGVTGAVGRRLKKEAGTLLAVVQAVGSAAMIAFGLAGRFWPAVAAYLVVVMARNAAGPVLGAWMVANTSSGSRATVFSMQAQVDALGQIAGGPPSGLVGQRLSIGAGIMTSGLFVLPAVLLFAWAAGRAKQARPAAAQA